MRHPATQRNCLTTAAGPRLRCFLRRSFAVLSVFVTFCCASRAQLDMPKPFRMSHLAGVVVDPYGKPADNVEITLLRDDKVVRTTQTDGAGRFAIEHVTGHYLIRMKTPHYSIVSREVFVQLELVTTIAGNQLYVILGPGQCSDDCSTVFTSKSDFNKALRRLTGHNR
jgi:Carboxypeptidase regulatory-like domain